SNCPTRARRRRGPKVRILLAPAGSQGELHELAMTRNRWFESASLQRRVCKLSVPERRTHRLENNGAYAPTEIVPTEICTAEVRATEIRPTVRGFPFATCSRPRRLAGAGLNVRHSPWVSCAW